MMGEEQNEVRVVYLEALARGAPGERAAYLDAACRDKPELRQRVEVLLRAREQLGEFLTQDALGGNLASDGPAVAERPGSFIGHYKLLEQIGEGGFGVVFMAEQVKPIRRKVALKIVKPGMDTKQVIARFEAERQALAMMDHPNIAKVFDAGATETGRPHFVMELVHGVPITQFCDANALAPHERLKLFMTVCEAVQHAHQKGILHRDLKPSNILVTLHDGKPVPKVIDFGTAKALQQPLTEKTLFTAYGKLIGTPQYMSPEQAEMSGLEMDTRTDIYSLGVLLYELLTGTTPLEAQRLRNTAFEEMMRIIREEEPPKPSTRVSTLGERAAEIAGHRQADAALLRRTLQGDVDWIVMKALEKDRSRRYDSASSLANDLRRHLENLPVLAGPPSVVYRLSKFARRRRAELIVAGSVAALVCVAAVLSYRQSLRTRQAEERAAASRAELKAALSQPAAASHSADTRARDLFNGMALVEKAAAVSPDERWLAFTDWSGPEQGVVVRELESGKAWKFTASGHDPGGIYQKTKELYAAAVARLTGKGPSGAEMPFEGYAWSQDSRWLAFLWMSPPTHDPQLRIVSPETGELRVVLPAVTNMYYEPLDWSPDGKWLVCMRQNQRALFLASVPEGRLRYLASLDAYTGSTRSWPLPHARFSPDGKYVVYTQPTGEGEPAKRPHTLYVTEVETGTSWPLNLPGNCRNPIWSPSQPVLLFTSDRLGTWDLWGVRARDGKAVSEPFPVQYGIGCYELKLTRAGKLLVHRDVKPGDGYTIVVPRGSTPLKVEALPGRIYFTMNGTLHAMTVKDAKATLVPLGYPAPPSRSLHGGHRWFLELRALKSAPTNNPPRELFVRRDDAEPDRAIQLTDLPGVGQMTGVHSFAMTLIRPGQERDRIIGWARDAGRGLDDGLISWTAPKPGLAGSPVGPSPPGIYVARVAFDAAGNVTGLAETLSAEPLVTNATTHDWSPDGRQLVYTQPGSTNVLRILDLATKQSSVLTEGEAPAWSPDGTRIAFHHRNASLHLIRPDGSDLRTLETMDAPNGMKFTLPRPGFYRVVWAPDSKALAYDFWEYGGLGISYHQVFHRPLDGGPPQCLTPDLMTDASPVAWLEGEE